MEADRLVGIVAVVVVPVEQRARRLLTPAPAHTCRSTPQTSTSQALGIRLLLIMLITVQGTTPKYSSIEVQHCTALMCTSVSRIQPSTTAPSFAILISASSGTPSVGTYALISSQLRRARPDRCRFMRSMRPEDLGEVDRLHRDAARFQDLLAVADGVEGGGPRADGADARLAAVPCTTRQTPANHSKILREVGPSRAPRCAAWSASTECRTA